jgi:uncharacterized protein
MFEIRDPIHGMVPFNELERDIINSAPFQRLRRIRQLALTDYVYPSAMHTRFEHSIGVMHVASRLYDAILRDQRSREILRSEFGLSDEELVRRRQVVRLAALTHDLGHGPLSHAAEELFPRRDPSDPKSGRIQHEEYSAEIIKGYIGDIIKSHRTGNELGIDPVSVAGFIHGAPVDSVDALFKDIVSGTLDADRMDYLIRDSYHCGVRYGQFDIERIINTIGICKDVEFETHRIGIDSDGIHAAEGLVIARFMMFTQVYMHKTRLIYDYHFEECMRVLLENDKGIFPSPRSEKELASYLRWDDWRVHGILADGGGGPHGEIIRTRNHFRLVYETEEGLEDAGRLERARKTLEAAKNTIGNLGVIEKKARKSWYSTSSSHDILVREAGSEDSKGVPLSQRTAVVKSLIPVDQMRLYVPSEHADSARKKISEFRAKRGSNG